MNYQLKYLKYKRKYLNLKGGIRNPDQPIPIFRVNSQLSGDILFPTYITFYVSFKVLRGRLQSGDRIVEDATNMEIVVEPWTRPGATYRVLQYGDAETNCQVVFIVDLGIHGINVYEFRNSGVPQLEQLIPIEGGFDRIPIVNELDRTSYILKIREDGSLLVA